MPSFDQIITIKRDFLIFQVSISVENFGITLVSCKAPIILSLSTF